MSHDSTCMRSKQTRSTPPPVPDSALQPPHSLVQRRVSVRAVLVRKVVVERVHGRDARVVRDALRRDEVRREACAQAERVAQRLRRGVRGDGDEAGEGRAGWSMLSVGG